MNRETLLHSGVLAIALAATAVAALSQVRRSDWGEPAPSTAPVMVEQGKPSVEIPPRPYRRIVALNASALLHQLVSVDRIAAVDAATANDPQFGWCFANTTKIEATNNIQSIATMNPDLVIVSEDSVYSPIVNHFRATEVPVLVLSEVHDFAGARERMKLLAHAVEAEDRAERLIRALDERARILSAHAIGLSAIFELSPGFPEGQKRRIKSATELAGLLEVNPGDMPQVIIHATSVSEASIVGGENGPSTLATRSVSLSVNSSSSPFRVELPAGTLTDRCGLDLIEAATFIAASVQKRDRQ